MISMLTLIKQRLLFLENPVQEFKQLHKRPLEQMVADYLKLLLFTGILAGLLTLLFSFGKSAYYDIFLHIDVQYARMFNYLIGRAFSIAFFFIFAGSFFLFFLSIILIIFLRIKYATLFKILFLALTPLLLFSWIPYMPPALFLWSIFLFIIGLRHAHDKKKIKKDSIQQRD